METVIRVAAIFLFITAALRLIGKRELAELSPNELVMIMLIPEICTQALSHDDASLTNAFIGTATLLSLVFFTSLLSYRFPLFGKVEEGEPVVLFYNGKFLEEALHRERVTTDEIMSEVRAAGFESLDAIKLVVLESDGNLSCVPYERERVPRRKAS